MRPARLSDDEVQQALANCPGWSLVDGKLQREFQFADFQEAFAFMTRCAEVAESLDQPPGMVERLQPGTGRPHHA